VPLQIAPPVGVPRVHSGLSAVRARTSGNEGLGSRCTGLGRVPGARTTHDAQRGPRPSAFLELTGSVVR